MAAAIAALLVSGIGIGIGAGPAAADDGPGIGRLSTRADRLMREASNAVAAHEKARDAVRKGERRLADVTRRQATEQRRLDALRATLGRQARSEYQGASGLGTMLPLLTSSSPQRALDATVRAGRGDRAARQLTDRVTESRDRVADRRAESARLVKGLKAQERRRSAARDDIEAKLAKAEAEVRRARARVLAAGPMPTGGGGNCARGDVGGHERAGKGRTWVKPVSPATLSAGFGSGGRLWAHTHTGQDFAVPTGTPVRAVGAGTVVFTGCGDGFGNQVVLRHADGYYTQYAHLSRIGVKVGSRLAAGETLGLSGATGNVSGPHLHFEVRITPQFGSGIDPLPWLRARGLNL
ncbi:M23 family metallopeptidase [Streptomyces endophyticus]|uniref:Peptidoglycan DD-metalloendopeptidase family protein n=1 Tax=Streptomyces endophyticus TaxID=714166 RepID=A0ABU6FIW8_9ACTN|nr:peptidoglycan DD-metalloendopeptidase family protein [Streptomyces endophyticus]MEB8344004.1 peptidoglycan DD-metalloendopeptidase family protein [Streptomyces endophyticus]